MTIDATLFGAGSIACGFAQALLLTPEARGRIAVVDNGRFDPRNPVKYSLLDATTANSLAYKAPWLCDTLRVHGGARFQALASVATAEQFTTSLPSDYQIPLAISAVDTNVARFEIQDALPYRIVNAGIDGTTSEVSVHGFGEGACLACLGMQKELESWDPRPIAERTGIGLKRVRALIASNVGLEEEDLVLIRAGGKVSSEILAGLDSFLGQPLLSLWNRVAYAEAVLNNDAGAPVRVTTAFVSAFAGVMLLAETLKQSVPALAAYRVNNSYRQDLLGVPAGGVFPYPRYGAEDGSCLCRSAFRLAAYSEKYGRESSPSCYIQGDATVAT